MNAELLLKHFDRMSEAPEAVTRLRQFILDLAVRGKLVEPFQSAQPTDATNRAGLTTEGPFQIPFHWQWRCIEDISELVTDGEHLTPPRISDGQVPLVTAKNVRDGEMDYSITDWVSIETAQKAWRRCKPSSGDILLVCVGATTGRLCVLEEPRDMVLVRSVAVIRPSTAINVQYLALAIRSPACQTQIWKSVKVTAQPCLYINRTKALTIPVPPIDEQNRIVAKMEELMALCDRLEAAQLERERRRDRLAAASLHRLNNPAGAADPELFRAHARFYINHLPRLTTRPDQIKHLRQTILNLAVRGKLVRQDAHDAPPSEILARIQIEQDGLIRAKSFKRSESASNFTPNDIPFEIPSTWIWTTLQNLIVFGPQNGISPMPSSRPDAPLAITLTATTRGTFDPQFYKSVDAAIPKDSEFWLQAGDLLFQRGNTRDYVGMAAYYPGKAGLFLYPDLMMKVRVSKAVNLRYVHLCAIAPPARSYFSTSASGAQATMPKINQETLLRLPIPLAPLAEQNQIVAKTDELLTLCSRQEGNCMLSAVESKRVLDAILQLTLNWN